MAEGKAHNTLRALSGPLAGATFEVGPRLLIGRVPACDVVLADVEVSREHAMIVSDAGTPTLVDLGSSNGTFVDGKRVERVRLQPGSVFTIAGSRFAFDTAPPVSTRPVLALQFSAPPNVFGETDDTRATQETPAVSGPGVASVERPTRKSIAVAPSVEEVPGPVRPTIQLEAATPEPVGRERATVELGAVADGAPPEVEAEPLDFAPPPAPMPKKPDDARRPRKVTPISAGRDGVYAGDLLADITRYRSFRLRLQRGEIPTGEEVAAMIDLEAILREPPAESSTKRDVVTQRFFRRFPFSAPLCARFSSGGEVFEARGTVKNLSVDGLRCSLELGSFVPESNQHVVLVVDHTHGFLDVRYTITARVVYCRKGMAGFVFAGVPSWAERGAFQHAETTVRERTDLLE